VGKGKIHQIRTDLLCVRIPERLDWTTSSRSQGSDHRNRMHRLPHVRFEMDPRLIMDVHTKVPEQLPVKKSNLS
jgi:hypothetical protein